MIAAVGSVLLTPWNLYNNPEVIHYTLETLGAFIGPLFGVLIADFYLVKQAADRHRRPVHHVEDRNYWYTERLQPRAVVATIIGAAIRAMFPVLFGGMVGYGTARPVQLVHRLRAELRHLLDPDAQLAGTRVGSRREGSGHDRSRRSAPRGELIATGLL